MKKSWLVLLMALLCQLHFTAKASELTGSDIALRMDAVDTSIDSKKTAIMEINRKGQKLVRKMEMDKPISLRQRLLSRPYHAGVRECSSSLILFLTSL